MTLNSAEHSTAERQRKRTRADGRREYRAAGGRTYRKVRVKVRILDVPDEVDPTSGEHLRLATSDTPVERDRYFRVWREGGRWKCRCAANGALGSCYHVGYLRALEAGDLDEADA